SRGAARRHLVYSGRTKAARNTTAERTLRSLVVHRGGTAPFLPRPTRVGHRMLGATVRPWRTMADDRCINICFHGVGTPRRELEPGEDVYWISEDAFRRILDEIGTW